ncbi:MAG: hypothetical protein RQ729_12585 [Wenzhouxiangellaceae bacterium]|nr:hypothetical protein [Wenzhouxiangellaceae bacterium]
MLPITRHHSVHVPHTLALIALIIALALAGLFERADSGALPLGTNLDGSPNSALQTATAEPAGDPSLAEAARTSCRGDDCASERAVHWFPIVLPALSRF